MKNYNLKRSKIHFGDKKPENPMVSTYIFLQNKCVFINP